MERRRAFITGLTGQDGTYLAKFLLAEGYEVYGVDGVGKTPHIPVTGHRAFDLRDQGLLRAYLSEVRPHECYHLAAYHRSSAKLNVSTNLVTEERLSFETNVLSVQTILSTLREVAPACRVFLAGSCHMFGHAAATPQSEQTPFLPANIYAVTKVSATLLGRLYRDQYGMFVCTGILFNHESPLRSTDFVTARIAKTAVDISRGEATELVLGNLEAQVDWGFAGDYVQAMHRMLTASQPEDFVIASGSLHSVREFVELAFQRVGLDWRKWVREDSAIYKPVSQTVYQGDSSAIQSLLGWRPLTTFPELVAMMVDHYLTQ